MTKIIYALMVIIFWACLPAIMSFMYSDCYTAIDMDQYKSIEEPTAWDAFGGMFAYLGVIFQVMFLGIPCAPFWVKLFTWIINIFTILIVFVFIRGE
jgi:hypothetical protein